MHYEDTSELDRRVERMVEQVVRGQQLDDFRASRCGLVPTQEASWSLVDGPCWMGERSRQRLGELRRYTEQQLARSRFGSDFQ